MKRITLILLQVLILICFCSGAVLAGPAYPGVVTVTDDVSGKEIKVHNYGDEFFSYTADLNGNLLLKDGDGALCYIVEKDGAFALGERVTAKGGSFLPSMAVGEPVNINNEITDLEEKLTALEKECAAQADTGIGLSAATDPAPFPEDVAYDYADDPLKGKIGMLTAVNKPAMGSDCALLVLKIEFNDVKCQFTDAQWHKRIFDDGVSDYYTKVSNDQFTYVPAKETAGTADDGVITVTLPLNQPRYCRWTEGQNTGNDCKAGIYTGIDGTTKYGIYNSASIYGYGLDAAADKIDFSQYDKNKDGFVSPTELAVLVVISGYEVSYGGLEKSIGKPAAWAHSWYLNNYFDTIAKDKSYGYLLTVIVDGVKLYKYTMIGENVEYGFDYDSDTNTVDPRQVQFGTATHELGHDMGLLDLYDTSYGGLKLDVGHLSLMASGSWGQSSNITGEPGDSPSFLDPYSKLMLGFTEETEITAAGDYLCHEAASPAKYNILRLNTADPDIYYLIENRTAKSYDKSLNTKYGTNGGVVIWRIDQQVVDNNFISNCINCHEDNYGVMPVFNESQGSVFSTAPFRNDESAVQFGASVVLQSSPLLEVFASDPVSAAATVTLGSGADITSFTLKGENGLINASKKTVTVTLPYGSNVASAAATFTLSSIDATATVGGVKQISGTTTNDFKGKTVEYLVTPAGSATATAWTVTVKVRTATPANNIYFYGNGENSGIVTGIDNTLRYSVNYGTTWQAFANITDKRAAVSGVNVDDGLLLYRKSIENDAFSAVSEVAIIDIYQYNAPNLTATQPNTVNGKGFIPVTAAMDYKTEAATTWTAGTNDGVYVTPGTYLVRYAGGHNSLASKSQQIEIIKYVGSDKALLTSFALNGVDGVIDNANQTVTVTLPAGSDVTAAVAEFAISDKATVAVDNVPQVSGTTANNFDKKTVLYCVTAEDTTTYKDWTVTVKVCEATPAESIYFFGSSETGGTVVGVDDTLRFSVDGGTAWQDFASITDGKAAISGVTVASDIKLYRKAAGDFSAASAHRTIDIQKPAAPVLEATQPNTANGKGLIPVTAAMEYKTQTATTWTDGVDGGVELAPGNYQVRYAGAKNRLASASQQIEIIKYTGSDKAILTSFSLNGVSGTIDASKQTVTVTLPSGSDVTAAVAQFTVSDKATVTVGSVPQISGTTANNFDKKTVVYRVTAENTTTHKDWTVTVKVQAAPPGDSIYFFGSSQTGGTVIGVDSTLGYSVDGGMTWQDFAGISDGKATISGVNAQSDLRLYRKADGAFSVDSEQRTIDIQKPAAPDLTASRATVAKGKGMIPLTAAMEYRYITSATWLKGVDGGVAVDPGRYQLRYAGGRNVLVSAIQYIDVKTVQKTFTDVKEGNWFYKFVTPICDLELMSGVSGEQFDPYGVTERAMVAQILWNLEGNPDEGVNSGFSDVPQNVWYSKSVTWAKKNAIVSGYDEKTFGPKDAVTRAQLTAIFYRYVNSKGLDVAVGDTTLARFSDAADVPKYAVKSMTWAVDRKIVNGTSPTQLEPKANAERAQIATVIYQLLNVYYQ